MFFIFEFVCKILCQMKFTIKKQNNEHSFKLLVIVCKFLFIFYILNFWTLFVYVLIFGLVVVGAGYPSTFLGYKPCPRMIKYLRIVKRSMHTWVGRPRRKEESDMVTEVPEEQRHLKNALGSQPLWKDKLQGK